MHDLKKLLAARDQLHTESSSKQPVSTTPIKITVQAAIPDALEMLQEYDALWSIVKGHCHMLSSESSSKKKDHRMSLNRTTHIHIQMIWYKG